MMRQTADVSQSETPSATAPLGPLARPGGCPPPANIHQEVAQYDARAAVKVWPSPRYRLKYRVLGSGPPLIWLPGIASTYRIYAIVLNELAKRFTTIQYAYPGDEANDGARLGRITHDHLVDDLLGFIEHLGLREAVPVGISFGSTIVLKALAREPSRFPRAVVQGAFAHRRFTTPERLALFLGRLIPGTIARLPFREKILTLNSRLEFPWVIENRWPFYLEQNGLTPIGALAHRSTLLTRLDLRAELARVESQVLLVQGRDDRIVPHRYFQELQAALPRAQAVLMPMVGHMPHLTHAETLARVIGDWLLPCSSDQCEANPAAASARCAGNLAAASGGCTEAGSDCPGKLAACTQRDAGSPGQGAPA
ncbi:MAG: alpha/beta hydrolase [Planctomycetaceae bacterium]|nr:alpha/beta hydrolase [Planctomycetaceae bacterium]